MDFLEKENLEQMANPEDAGPKKYVTVELNITDLAFRWLSMGSRLHFNREGQLLQIYGPCSCNWPPPVLSLMRRAMPTGALGG